jgi:predicted phage terminase large subunit-like protein
VGGFFNIGRIELVDEDPPYGVQKNRGWDIAATKDGGDFTASGRIDGPDEKGYFWIVDASEAQLSSDEVDDLMRQKAALDGYQVVQHVPQDPGAAGKRAGEHFIRVLSGYPVVVEPVTGSKEIRARPLASMIGAGRVKMKRGWWNKIVLDRFLGFPKGPDDVVDALADAYNMATRGSGQGGDILSGGKRDDLDLR